MSKIIWTEEETNFLLNHFNDFSNTELAFKLNKTTRNVIRTLRRLNLIKNLDSVKKIKSRRNKEVGTDLTFQHVSKIAKKYNSRGEFYQFDPICYNKAVKEEWLDKICQHMVIKNVSIPQLMMKDLLEYLLKTKCSYNESKIIKPLELDCYFSKWKMAWEYDGVYFHTEKKDEIKKEMCLKKDIILFNITEKTKEYRNYNLNIKNHVIRYLDKINEITSLSITQEEVINYEIQLLLPNKLTIVEKEIVWGKTMTEIKKINLELFKRIKKYKLYENIELNIIYNLKTNNKFKNIEEYINYIVLKYSTFSELCKKEHPHRLLKKWGFNIKIIHDLYKN